MGSRNLNLAVDHKPLIKIFNNQELSSISNPRLLQLKEKTLLYCYKIIHVPGKSNIMKVADITSRNPVREPEENDQPTLCETAITLYTCHQAEGITAVD